MIIKNKHLYFNLYKMEKSVQPISFSIRISIAGTNWATNIRQNIEAYTFSLSSAFN